MAEPDQTMTIKDVAAASGVSRATVSQVLGKGRRHVSPTTRERILRVAAEMNYQPSAVARGLTKGRMNTIGVAFPHWQGDIPANIFSLLLLDGVLDFCMRHHLLTSLCVFPDWDHTENTLALTDGRCDGVLLLVPPTQCPLLDILHQRRVPVVLVSGRDPSGRTASIDIDNAAAARQSTEYLIGLGHRRIAFFSRDFDKAYAYLHERQEGYRQAMADAGFSADIRLLTDRDEAVLIGPASDRPTALVCVFDDIALNVMDWLQQRGLAIPGDMSIVGLDDVPNAATAQPPLTSVRQPMTQIGRRAAERLFALIDGTDTAVHECLPTELIVRQSAAPPSDGISFL